MSIEKKLEERRKEVLRIKRLREEEGIPVIRLKSTDLDSPEGMKKLREKIKSIKKERDR